MNLYTHIYYISIIILGTLADVCIQVEPSLRIDRDTFSGILDRVVIQVRIDDLLVLTGLRQDLRVGVSNQAMAKSVVRRTHVSGWATHGDIDLVIHSTCASEQLPVQGTCRQVKRAGVDEQEGSLTGGDHGCLREADVIADSQTDLAVLRQVDDSQFVPW